MPDNSTYAGSAPNNPAGHSEVLPDATTTELAEFSRGIYVGCAGNLTVVMGADGEAGTLTTFTAVPTGTLLPIRIHTISDTSTATCVVAIY
jgi:hypothetical protein